MMSGDYTSHNGSNLIRIVTCRLKESHFGLKASKNDALGEKGHSLTRPTCSAALRSAALRSAPLRSTARRSARGLVRECDSGDVLSRT